jgi:hypothetical protein
MTGKYRSIVIGSGKYTFFRTRKWHGRAEQKVFKD